MRLADRSTSLKTQQVAGPCRAKVKLPAEPVVIIGGRFFAGLWEDFLQEMGGWMEVGNMRVSLRKRKRCHRDTLREVIVCLTVESVPGEEKT